MAKATVLSAKYEDSQPLSLFVFKTLADPLRAAINYFKVKSGVLKTMPLTITTAASKERFQHIQVVQASS